MKVELNDNESRLLVEALYIASWVIAAGEEFDDVPYKESFDRLEQKLLAALYEDGQGDVIGHSPERNQFYPSGEIETESKAREALDAFTCETFNRELMPTLAQSQISRRYSKAEWAALEEPTRRKLWDEALEDCRATMRIYGYEAICLMPQSPAQ